MAGIAAAFRHRASATLGTAASAMSPPVISPSTLSSAATAAKRFPFAAVTRGHSSAAAATRGHSSSSAAATGRTFPFTATPGTLRRAAITRGHSSSAAAATGRTFPFTATPATLRRAAITRGLPSSPLVRRRYLSSLTTAPGIHRLSPFCPFRRYMTKDAVPREVRREIERIQRDSAARHKQLLADVDTFQTTVMNEYSAAATSRGEAAFQVGKVAWRVSFTVLVFGVTTIVTVMQTVKAGWFSQFDGMAKEVLEEMLATFKKELLDQMKEMVRKKLKEEEEKKKG